MREGASLMFLKRNDSQGNKEKIEKGKSDGAEKKVAGILFRLSRRPKRGILSVKYHYSVYQRVAVSLVTTMVYLNSQIIP